MHDNYVQAIKKAKIFTFLAHNDKMNKKWRHCISYIFFERM